MSDKKHNVLLVDDDTNLLRGLVRILHDQPYHIMTAKSAEEATLTLKTNEIDLIVCDECMPGTKGSDLLEWVAEECPDTVRIMLTGQPSIPTAMKAINGGQVFRFLVKPCRDFDLAMAIREGLESRETQLAEKAR